MTSPLSRERIGWPLLPVPDAQGELRYPTLERSVRDSIEILLRTRPGEQLMRPRFGGGLADLLSEPNTLLTRRRIHARIVETLEAGEPRIEVDRVEVHELPQRPDALRVEIAYRLRRDNTPLRLGFNLGLAL